MSVHTFAPILMTEDEAAYYLGISKTTLNRLQNKRELMPRQNGGIRGWLRDDLDAYARSLPTWEGRDGGRTK